MDHFSNWLKSVTLLQSAKKQSVSDKYLSKQIKFQQQNPKIVHRPYKSTIKPRKAAGRGESTLIVAWTLELISVEIDASLILQSKTDC